ncbi:putative MFS family arabinose efflux permease [Pseudomonas hunanensis]|uniref:MFS family arabinose efflux permease n=1 Tax=Pseudomonas hunanensis TaxID=1247546 RepID=A0ACC6K0T0_9PSED|nr:MFS transporter [Pseudomonas hunanensis]MDR6712045.1 putative MFS family arabinose efflux permease [Pseudomonas hunanensis]
MNKHAALAALLTCAMGLPMMVFYALGVLGPQLIAELGIDREQLGWLTTSAFGLAALLSPWAGALVQRIGSRNGLLALFLLVALSFSLMAVLPGFSGVVIALLFCGVAQALANPATNQAIALAEDAPKASLVGLKQAGVQVSALIAGLALPPLSAWLGWRLALACWVPLALLLALLVPLQIAAPPAGPRPAMRLAKANGWLLRLMAIQGCAGLCLSAFITFFGVYANSLGVDAASIGLMVSAFGVMGILSRLLLTPLGAGLKDETVLLGGLFIFALGTVVVMQQAAPQRHWPLWAAVVGMGLSLVASNAVAMSMLLREPRFGGAASSAGLLSLGFFGGIAIGPPLFGALLRQPGGFSAAWSLLIFALCVGAVLCRSLYRARRSQELSSHAGTA